MNSLIPQYDIDGLGGEYLLTQEVEKRIASFLGVRHCVMVSSGTAALFIALRVMGAKRVAVPALTMFGTAVAAELAGCDITFVSNNEIPEDVDTYLHVALNGRDCDIVEVMRAYPNLRIIEDACQSFGSMHQNRYLGTFGTVGCFSFSPHKIISAGNGGCIVTNDDSIAREVRKLKNFGRESGGADVHESIGYNFKFTDIQAAFMLPQFETLAEKLAKKTAIYSRYYDSLSAIMRPHKGTPWFVDVYVEDRDKLIDHLTEQNIGTRKMYPLLSTQKPFKSHSVHGDSESDKTHSEQGIWLPSSTKLSDEEIGRVIEAVTACM